jgi:hypothetical protein
VLDRPDQWGDIEDLIKVPSPSMLIDLLILSVGILQTFILIIELYIRESPSAQGDDNPQPPETAHNDVDCIV